MQILIRVRVPSMSMVARCTFACQRVFVCRFEKLTLLPAWPDFRHISHLAICYLFDCAQYFSVESGPVATADLAKTSEEWPVMYVN